MRPGFRTLAAAAAVLLLPAAARAQAAGADSAAATARLSAPAEPVLATALFRPLAAGDQVRLVSPGGRYSGTLTQVTADSLTLASPGRTSAVVRADVSEMRRLVSRESRGKTIVRGAAVGLLGGVALGYLVGTSAGGGDCAAADISCSPGHDRTAQAAFTIDGAIVGSLVGAMLGPTFRRSRWERVTANAVALPAPAASDPVASRSQ